MFNNVKLGIAPIGWTNDDMPQLGGELTFEQMVSEAALAGFQGTEVGGKFPTDPAVLNKALCAASRLHPSGSRASCARPRMRRTKRHLSSSWTSSRLSVQAASTYAS